MRRGSCQKTFLKAEKGSLLVEALLSVMILSASITMIIQAMTASLRAAAYSTEYTKAVFLLENKMSELLQAGDIPIGKNEEGQFPSPDEKYGYLLKTENINDENAPELNKVFLEIFWRSGQKTNRIKFETLLLNQK